MRTALTHLLSAAAGALVVGAVVLLGTRSGGPEGAGTPGEIPRTAEGHPDVSGIWQANSSAHWDLLSHEARPMVAQPGAYPDVPVLAAPVVALGATGWIPADLGVVDGDEIPYQPWAAARQRENLANRLDRDPEIRCYLPGIPRAMYMPYKFQIIQGPAKVMMAFEFRNAERTIHLDEVVQYPGDAFMGHSVGRWEGDTLVVDVSRFTPYTWFDRAGNFHSDALRVTERYTPMTRDAIRYEARIEDPKVFTRPWTIRLPLYRRLEPEARLIPHRCMEMAEETALGHLRRQPLVRRWESRTMVVDVTRRVPAAEEELYRLQVSGNPPEN
ncbi:MAG: hypothetical protein A3I61_05425 [Acidobacteria bacterium RIFCSPLOWO2_02_FULL_68_18]|nr:MAG: hypothetical protein A3I61_05425 [Acidobacteria bacterium RIFCSPLOWO2_02_FULL_68_18]OFW49282.1 MAG: hypothetical protein A3G77_04225 [Acidobacteria bacterium RIFCSPLOWO2_12_FULL_68_19]